MNTISKSSKKNVTGLKALQAFMSDKKKYELDLSIAYGENEVEVTGFENTPMIPQVIYNNGKSIKIEFDVWDDNLGWDTGCIKTINASKLSEDNITKILDLIKNGKKPI